MNKTSRLVVIACVAAAAGSAVTPRPAAAWERHGYGGGGYGGRYYRGGYGYGGGGLGFGLGAGALLGFGLGALASRPYDPPPVYYAPPPVVYAPPPVVYAPSPGFYEAPAQASGGSCYAGAYVCPLNVAVPAGAQCACPGHNGLVYGRAG